MDDISGTGVTMARKEIEKAVETLLENSLAEQNVELVDVEYVRERDWILRIFIDKDGGVDLNDCQRISELAGTILDKKDFISGKCYSPLDDRKELKAFTAELRGLTEDGKIKLIYNEEELIVDKDKISQMRLHFSF